MRNINYKKVFLTGFLVTCFFCLQAQQVKIGNNIMSFKPSVLLDLEDTNKALLLTRVADPNISIKNPYLGMITFDSTLNQLAYYNGTDWIYSSKSNNIYNTDGVIENTTAKTRTIARDGNLIVFQDTSKILTSPTRDYQMKTYDTITFGQYGRVGIGTTNPMGKLDVRGPIYIYADATNNAGFAPIPSTTVSRRSTLPSLVLQPDTTDLSSGTRSIYMSFFNRKIPTLFPGATFTPGSDFFISGGTSSVFLKENRTDIGFLGNAGVDSNLFTIWNRTTTKTGLALRVGDNGILKLADKGQIGITAAQYATDTALLFIDSRIPYTGGDVYKDSTRDRYPVVINGGTSEQTGTTLYSNLSIPFNLRSKYGILFTASQRSTISSFNNLIKSPEYKLSYLWVLNPNAPVLGISTYFRNGITGYSTGNFPYADMPVSGLYDIIRFYIDQPNYSGNENTDKGRIGITVMKIINFAEQRYSKLAFTESDLSSKWEFRKMGKTISSLPNFLPQFTAKAANDFYIVKDSIEPWMQFVYAGNKIIFYKNIDLPSNPNIVSDARIKKIKDTLDHKTALEKINALKVVDYTMKKDTAQEKTIQRGVIAQEVEKILPEAVTTSKTVHPLSTANIEEYAESFRIDSSKKKAWYIDIKLSNHGLKQGDKLYLKYFGTLGLLAPSYLQENVAEVVDKDHFKLPYSAELSKAKKIYVIGQEIKDMKTVNYNYLNMTNIAATQELSSQLDIANEKIKTLELEIAELKKLVQELTKNPK